MSRLSDLGWWWLRGFISQQGVLGCSDTRTFFWAVSFWITESSCHSLGAVSEACEETIPRTVFRAGSRTELGEVRGRAGSWKGTAERQPCYYLCSWSWRIKSIFLLQKDRVVNNVGKWHCLLTGPEAPPVNHWEGASIHLTLYL